MKPQDVFVANNAARWRQLEQLPALPLRQPAQLSQLASLYRRVCGDLARARSQGFCDEVVGSLDGLAARAHNALYASQRTPWSGVAHWLLRELPSTVRAHCHFVWVAAALFVLPLVLGLTATLRSPEFAESVLPAQLLEQMSQAYAEGFGEGRAAEMSAAMTGFYVYNNVGIALRCFATGILFGTGSVFFLTSNGLTMGTVIGYVAHSGHGRHILTFVSGHAPFELTAIVLSGAAGLVLGYSLVATGNLTRIASLQRRARSVLTLALGAALLLVVAAVIEGFWSPSSAPASVKYGVGVGHWLAVVGFFTLAGRREPGRA